MCAKHAERHDKGTPCGECRHAPPALMAGNIVADIVYAMSFQARTGMGDSLDYGMVTEVMDQLGIEGQERIDTVQKIMIAEQAVKDQMGKNSEQEQKAGPKRKG